VHWTVVSAGLYHCRSPHGALLERAVARVLPSQANLFGFAILKPRLPRDLQPWLRETEDGPAPNEAWIRGRLGS
jgi:hypothetical protein